MGRDVLEHDLEGRIALHDHREVALEEDGLAIEDVHFRIRHLAVDQQRNAGDLHRLQHRIAFANIGHARCRIRRGTRGVVLHRLHEPRLLRALDLARRCLVGEIERHEGLEGAGLGKCLEDAIAISLGLARRRHRRNKVGHHDGAGKTPSRGGDDRLQRLAVAKMRVPIVRAGDGKRFGHRMRIISVNPSSSRAPGHKARCACHR